MTANSDISPVMRFFRFLLTGGFAALANIGSRIALSAVMSYEWAVALAYLVGMVTAYLLARAVVFERSGDRAGREFLRFAIVNVFSMAIVWLMSVGLARHIFPALGFIWHADTVAHVIGVLSPVVPSYLGHKYYSFRTRRDDSAA